LDKLAREFTDLLIVHLLVEGGNSTAIFRGARSDLGYALVALVQIDGLRVTEKMIGSLGALNLLVRIATLLDRERAMSKSSHNPLTAYARQRRHLVVDPARQLELLDGEQESIGGRIRYDLISADRHRSGHRIRLRTA